MKYKFKVIDKETGREGVPRLIFFRDTKEDQDGCEVLVSSNDYGGKIADQFEDKFDLIIEPLEE